MKLEGEAVNVKFRLELKAGGLVELLVVRDGEASVIGGCPNYQTGWDGRWWFGTDDLRTLTTAQILLHKSGLNDPCVDLWARCYVKKVLEKAKGPRFETTADEIRDWVIAEMLAELTAVRAAVSGH